MRIKYKLSSALYSQIIIPLQTRRSPEGVKLRRQKALISINLQALLFAGADKNLFHLCRGPEWHVVLLAMTDKSS